MESVALTKRPPFTVNYHVQNMLPDSRAWQPEDQGIPVDVTWVDEGYAETLGLSLVRGRAIAPQDVAGAPKVAIVNLEAARRLWPEATDVVGRGFRVGNASGPEFEVVGVVSDYTVRAVGEEPKAMVHFAYAQRPSTDLFVLARSAHPAATTELALLMRETALSLDPDLAFAEVTSLEGMAGITLFPVRAGSVLLSIFAALGLFLAAVGLHPRRTTGPLGRPARRVSRGGSVDVSVCRSRRPRPWWVRCALRDSAERARRPRSRTETQRLPLDPGEILTRRSGRDARAPARRLSDFLWTQARS